MNTNQVVVLIVSRFRERGYAQVPGYKRFGLVSIRENHLVVTREDGKDTRIPFAKIAESVNAVRKDPKIYSGGPSKLRDHGITHINSPLWALLHLLTLEKLTT